MREIKVQSIEVNLKAVGEIKSYKTNWNTMVIYVNKTIMMHEYDNEKLFSIVANLRNNNLHFSQKFSTTCAWTND